MLSFPNYNLHSPVGIFCFTPSVVMVWSVTLPWSSLGELPTFSHHHTLNQQICQPVISNSKDAFTLLRHSPPGSRQHFCVGWEQLHQCVLFKFGMWNATFLSLLYAIGYGVKVFSPSPRKESSASQICFGFLV